MGNCLRVNMAMEAEDEAHVLVRDMEAAKQKVRNVHGGKNKKARSNVSREEEGEGEDRGATARDGDSEVGGVVRIRVVVTQEELKQLLTYSKDPENCSSVEQLLRRVKRRSKKVHDHGGVINGSWRPALESIPEDH